MKKTLMLLGKMPKLKLFLKRCFYIIGNIFSDKKTSDIVNPYTTGKAHLFGYYGKSMWNKSLTKAIYLQVDEERAVEGNNCKIILKDEKSGKEKILFNGNVWNSQQGNMLQWIGPNFEDKVAFNYFENNNFVTKILSFDGSVLETLPLPFYEFSNKGDFIVTLDFERLSSLRPGYGYSPNNKNKKKFFDEKVAIVYYSLQEKNIVNLIDYSILKKIDPKPSMSNATHKVNHIQISPNDDKFIFIHRWIKDGVKYDRLLLYNFNTNEIKILLDYGMVSHSYWKNNNEIVTYSRYKGKDGYYKININSKEIFVEELVVLDNIRDGHPITTKDERYMIFDSYPDFFRKQYIYVYSFQSKQFYKLAEIYSKLKYFGDLRVDLHPRLSFDDQWLSIDGGIQNRRQIYSIKVDELLKKIESEKVNI